MNNEKGGNQNMWGVLLIMLVGYSIWDIRKKSLPVAWVAAGLVISLAVGIGYRIWADRSDLFSGALESLCGMLPGAAFVLLALLMKEKIGEGDGLILAIIGGITGFKYALVIWMAALFCSFLYSCVLLVFYKKDKKYRFPFVPFYLCGTILVFFAMVRR